MTWVLKICPPVSSEELNALFTSAWRGHQTTAMGPLLEHALFYVCAYDGEKLIGFAKVVGDGGVHGFLLDPTVAPTRQRNGIGRSLVQACANEARQQGIEWLHVDFEPGLEGFYLSCGFSPTKAGVLNLRNGP
jgi:GNAT superfamily N-acetyltransferase